MEAKKSRLGEAQRHFAEWPLSDPYRPTRNVTASAQALDHSLPGKAPRSSLPPLGLLSPREPLRWVRARALNVGAPASGGRGGARTRPPGQGAFGKTLRQAGRDRQPQGPPLRRGWRIATRADEGRGECPAGLRLPWVSAPTEDIFKGCNVGAGLSPPRRQKAPVLAPKRRKEDPMRSPSIPWISPRIPSPPRPSAWTSP